MSDFNRFSTYWRELTDAVYYRIRSAEGKVFTGEQINTLWQTEVNKRFFSKELLHGATTFLTELREREPKLHHDLVKLIREVPLDLGLNGSEMTKNGMLMAGAGLAAALLGSKSKAVKALGTCASMVMAGLGIKGIAEQVTDAGPAHTAARLRKITDDQLEKIRLLFETAEGSL